MEIAEERENQEGGCMVERLSRIAEPLGLIYSGKKSEKTSVVDDNVLSHDSDGDCAEYTWDHWAVYIKWIYSYKLYFNKKVENIFKIH